jgi:c-di-GMP phosphodiesterase
MTALLDQVILGCGVLFDTSRSPMAARVTVHSADKGGAPDAAGLLAALAEVWPEGAGSLSLNITNEAWLLAMIEGDVPSQIMVEVPSFLAGDPQWFEQLQRRSTEGLSMVLKGRPLQPLRPELMTCFRRAIIDRSDDRRLSATPSVGVVRVLPFVQSGNATPAEAGDSFQRGAQAVLGWPLGDAPDGSQPKKGVPTSLAVVMELIQRVEREEPADKLEAVLRADPTLAFRLMRFINSPGFGLSVEISSFQHALMMLGYGRLKRWLALLVTSAVDDPDLKPLMHLAVRRGLLMEELSQAQGDAAARNELFICGVFSLLDRMLGQTFSQLLSDLPMPARVAQCLIEGEGPFQPYLDLAVAVEMESPIDIRDTTTAMMLSHSTVNRAALRAMGVARQMRVD